MTTIEQPSVLLLSSTATRVHDFMDTPLGVLRLTAECGVLRQIDFERAGGGFDVNDVGERDSQSLLGIREELEQYFAGERMTFSILFSADGTAFQRSVWQALTTIPYGATATYGSIARMVGRPLGARAIGGANHVNPIPIVIPCHRVIGANGSMTGYAGGLERKSFLLDLERRARR